MFPEDIPLISRYAHIRNECFFIGNKKRKNKTAKELKNLGACVYIAKAVIKLNVDFFVFEK
jgi:hypothetical protein